MKGSGYSSVKKLIIMIGIIAAILAVVISFKATSQLRIIGKSLHVDSFVSIRGGREISVVFG